MALLLSPVGLILISAGRLLIISNYSSTTATTIASSGGYVNTLLGSITPLVPLFIPYVALLLLLFRQFLLSAIAFVFAAFIAPTSLALPVTRMVAAEDLHQLLVRIDDNRALTLTIALVILVTLSFYFQSFADALAALVVFAAGVALLSAPVIKRFYVPSPMRSAANGKTYVIPLFSLHALEPVSLPSPLRAAGNEEGHLMPLFSRHVLEPAFPNREHEVIIAALVILFVFWIIISWASLRYLGSLLLPGEAMTTAIALLAVIAFFPYIYNIYPVPHRTEYYVGVLRSPWLPAEKFSLKSGASYYGYALSEDQDWFIVLLSKTRRIVYIPTSDVVRRKVCETLSQRQLPTEPPLITTFYAKPPSIPYCADRKYLH
jgi:hypothetical protein